MLQTVAFGNWYVTIFKNRKSLEYDMAQMLCETTDFRFKAEA